ncbi:hypothetical protein G7067_10885 [Leucobacter insecticola]|uniref:ABC-2 type transport system permease protein n=1 Tax=Leucobacter insecticola TaxID=2714934 RepID=A0A6G8FKH9_9MICO|nr:hypothetical protein [Leucobacter insecticola]QIM16793.1 hypothetical protein G7067_10885 [Leucobacter insecticola]
MAARLFRLRLALLGSEFRGSFVRGLRTTLLLLVAAAAAVALALVPEWLARNAAERAVIDVIVGCTVLCVVFLVPFFDNRQNLETKQFASYPASPSSIALSLLVTSWVSWPFLLLLVWLVSLGILRPEWSEPGWIAPCALGLAGILALCGVRVMSGLSKLIAGPRFAGALRTTGAVLLVAFLPLAVFAGATALGSNGGAAMEEAAQLLSWTPFGAPFAALNSAAAGDMSAALVYLGILGGTIVFLIAVWIPIAWVSNERIDRPGQRGIARNELGWFERFSARPAQVIAARQLTYWARDPRYRVALFAIPIAPIFMLVAFWIAGADLTALALVPLPVILLLLGWSQHNDVAMDSTAIWEHVSSGIRGRADRAGRLAPVLMLGIPLALVGSSITVTVLGDWRVLPAVIGLNIAVLLVGSGVSSLFSVMMPYPATRPGDSPFVQPQWAGSGSGASQTLSMLLALVLVAPAAWFSVMAIINVELVENIWALFFGIGYGALILVLGTLIGGWIFDRSGPELVAVTQVFD